MDSSDNESDAGASPSLSDGSSDSSRSSSPTTLRIVCDPLCTPPRKRGSISVTGTPPPSSSTTPRRKKPEKGPTSILKPGSSKQPPAPITPTPGVEGQRKRKKTAQNPHPPPLLKRPKVNLSKRRRTKSERNSRAGKVSTKGTTKEGDDPVESVELDAEIDKFLEEKAIKNNLTATNVKSIIRHVITNNMVQKMIMSTDRRKKANEDSSDEEGYFEPKLTRARTKLLLEKRTVTPALWPIVAAAAASPVKPPTSETHALIHSELPEDSSGDEEYIPKYEEIHSEDESSSVASHTSDTGGSPFLSCGGGPSSSNKRVTLPEQRRNNKDLVTISPGKESLLFKTPPPLPKPKCGGRRLDSAIGLRTRSRLPLNDTALEDLEMQLIPPDITMDMYDWGQSDNQDYLAFVKEFLCPGQADLLSYEAGDDEDADPEYNVMEDEEEHDKEELRMDRAVKVSKKELNELVAELLEENHFTSGDELDEADFTSFCASQLSISGVQDFFHSSAIPSQKNILSSNNNSSVDSLLVNPGSVVPEGVNTLAELREDPLPPPVAVTAKDSSAIAVKVEPVPQSPAADTADVKEETETAVVTDATTSGEHMLILVTLPEPDADVPAANNIPTPIFQNSDLVPLEAHSSSVVVESTHPFDASFYAIIQEQMRQHIQLLAQSYVLTATRDDTHLKQVSVEARRLIIELNNFSYVNSVFRVDNLIPAWQLINSYPVKVSIKSPIKKKILEEKYLNEVQNEDIFDPRMGKSFPRHVVKAIAESGAFVYPQMLPSNYDQQAQDNKVYFTPSEDALLVYGIDQLEGWELKSKEKAYLIARLLLPCRDAETVYHRMRNSRKTKGPDTLVKAYFSTKVLPEGALVPDPPWDPAWTIPPISQFKENLPLLWKGLMARLYIYEQDSKSPNPTGSSKKKVGRPRTVRLERTKKGPIRKKDNKILVSSTFSCGTGLVQKQMAENPELAAFPILDGRGDAGAYMFIPKYALAPPGHNRSPEGTEASTTRTFCHPIPMYKSPSSSPTKLFKAPDPPLSITTVGKPFTLPEGVESQGLDVIDLSSLNTPMKRAILQHFEEDDDNVDEKTPTKPRKERTPSPKKTTTGEYPKSRIDQSARTHGDYVRGERNPSSAGAKTPASQIAESEDDEEDPIVIDEDIDLTEYEDNISEPNSSPIQTQTSSEIIILDLEDEDSMNSGGLSDPLCDGGEPGDKNKSGAESPSAAASTTTTSSPQQPVNASELQLGGCTGSNGNAAGEDEEDDQGDKRNNRGTGKPVPEDSVAFDEVELEEEQTEEVCHKPSEVPALSIARSPSVHPPKSQPSSGKRSSGGAGGDKNKRQLKKEVSSEIGPEQKGVKGETPKIHERKGSSGISIGEKAGCSKRFKRSPVAAKKRVPKSTTTVDKLLEEDKERDSEVYNAFLVAYLTKIQRVTEGKHPGLHVEFLKLLIDEGVNLPETELLERVKGLLKDYPQLVREFSTFLGIEDPETSQEDGFTEFQEMEAQLNFIRHLEKFTENSPQLKAKILQRFKILKEEPDLTEKDVTEGLAPFFQGNTVMLSAFRAMFPAIYRPEITGDYGEFEEVELEEETPSSLPKDSDVEVVKLPEEKTVPASNTCPCKCHQDTGSQSLSSRVKHCHECALKFQDGKVYVHNGRVTKSVNVVEFRSPTEARSILSGRSCRICIPETPSSSSSSAKPRL